ESIFNFLYDCYDEFTENYSRYQKNSRKSRLKNYSELYPLLVNSFDKWLIKYSNLTIETRDKKKLTNRIIYSINNEQDYKQAIIDYISTMTDNFAIKIFNELISFDKKIYFDH
ncbi:MAG: hypothetical protein GY730_08830, partial [bacterium]|nr:hypothetical protein [bacterium]